MNQSCVCGRRHLFLGGIAAAFAPAALSSGAFAAAKPHRIDVHHHLVPPAYVDAVRRAKLDNPPMVNWTPEKSLEDMDKAGTATSIVSPMPPQLGFLPPADAAKVARESNEWARQMAKDHPGRFGVFAMLPMPYIEDSLKEIEYALSLIHI